MAKKIELLATLRGDTELWYKGHVFDYDTMPREIAAEIALDRGTVRIFEQVDQKPAVPPPPPPEPQPSFSDVAKSLLKEGLEVEEGEEKEPRPLYEMDYKGGGWYNVINTETGMKMNRAALRKDEAEELIQSLTEGINYEKPTLIVREEDSD